MAVQRFHSFEEARRALWIPPGDPTLPQRLQAVFDLARLAPAAPPARGIHRFRTIEEANADREAWVQRRVTAAAEAALASHAGEEPPLDGGLKP